MSLVQMPLGYHFSEIACDYGDVRFTDSEPIRYIEAQLRGLPAIVGIELGCGTGRYTAELFAALDGRLRLHCVDASAAMLAELGRTLNVKYEGRYTATHRTAERVRFAPGAHDAVFAFNALHHFDLLRVLRNISEWLRPGGLAFLYTRTPSQNERGMWGRCFPGFAEKETRLKDADTLRAAVEATPGLRCVETKRFAYDRRADLKTVLDKVDNYHYSTFRLYRGGELEAATQGFIKRLRTEFPDPDNITWTDHNLMLVAAKDGQDQTQSKNGKH